MVNPLKVALHSFLFDSPTILAVIAKPALIQWAASEAVKYIQEKILTGEPILDNLSQWLEEARTAHRRKKEEAGDTGKSVHLAIEEWIKNKTEPALDELGMKMFNNFTDWAVKNKVKFLESEKQVYSPSLFVAGTLDMICEINGKKFLGDIKTSSGIYGREYFAQCAGYRLMIEEMGEKGFEGSIIIRIGKDGSFEEKYSYDYETDKKIFLACVELYRGLETFKI